MNTSPIAKAVELPNGTRLVRCAFQVNPHGYAEQYRGETPSLSKPEYNRLLAERCRELGIGSVAITHHNHVEDIDELASVLGDAGVVVFPGFELKSSEDVHILCLYEPGTPQAKVRSYLSEFGIHDSESTAGHANKTFAQTLELVQEGHKGICIAAHATNPGGLLRALSPGARLNAWRDENLLAIQIPGLVDDLPDDLRPIVQNKNPDYKRPAAPADGLAIAVVNAADVKHPDDLREPGATTRIKLASITIEGLRQAFLDPESRIVLNSNIQDEEPEVRLEAMAWRGGFLADQALHFHENLNVLIGGRGTGKSTVIESLRYVFGLEPLGNEATETHRQFVKSVLRSGSRVWVRVHSQRPRPRSYIIERGVGEAPVVRAEDSEILKLRPSDVLGDLQIYGQHEISELTRDKVRQTALIRRFVSSDADYGTRKESVLRALQKNRTALVETQKELDRNAEKLAALPGIEETLKSFKEAGLEEKLKHQSLLVREETCLKALDAKLEPFEEALGIIEESLPVDMALVSDEALKDLPNKEIFRKGQDILKQLETAAGTARTRLTEALESARRELGALRVQWDEKKKESQAAYEKTLRKLHREKIDGAEFVRLRQRIEELKPLQSHRKQLEKAFASRMEEREKLLVEWQGVLSEEFLELERAAKSASRKLRGQVKLVVAKNGDRQSFKNFIGEHLSGRKDQIIQAVERDQFSLPCFAKAALESTQQLQEEFGISAMQANNLMALSLDMRLALGEIALETTTEVSLNVAAEGQAEDWKSLQDLSKGQKATALLLLLLLDSKAPLVVDQPEDDLDNRFVTTGIVPRIRLSKRNRQFIFATHNANIPVLGDAELIATLSASGEVGEGQGFLNPDEMGAIDTPAVKSLVEDLLEGGHSAFESRRKKYRF